MYGFQVWQHSSAFVVQLMRQRINVRQTCVLEITNLVVSGAFEIFIYFWDRVTCLQCSTANETVSSVSIWITYIMVCLWAPVLGLGAVQVQSTRIASVRSFAVRGVSDTLVSSDEGSQGGFLANPL